MPNDGSIRTHMMTSVAEIRWIRQHPQTPTSTHKPRGRCMPKSEVKHEVLSSIGVCHASSVRFIETSFGQSVGASDSILSNQWLLNRVDLLFTRFSWNLALAQWGCSGCCLPAEWIQVDVVALKCGASGGAEAVANSASWWSGKVAYPSILINLPTRRNKSFLQQSAVLAKLPKSLIHKKWSNGIFASSSRG